MPWHQYVARYKLALTSTGQLKFFVSPIIMVTVRESSMEAAGCNALRIRLIVGIKVGIVAAISACVGRRMPPGYARVLHRKMPPQ